MKKNCPGCGAPLSDSSKQFCPQCDQLALTVGKLSSEDFEKLTRIASAAASETVKGSWKFKLQIIGILLGLVLFLAGMLDLLVGFNIKQTIESRFQKQDSEAKQKMDDHLDRLDKDIATNLAQADFQMRSNIFRNFKEPVIQGIIESVAKNEAKAILENEVRPVAETFQKEAAFLRLATRARAFDFRAFAELTRISLGTDETAELASKVVREAERAAEKELHEESGPFARKRFYSFSDGSNIFKGPFTTDELALTLITIRTNKWSENREGFINTIRELRQPLFLGSLVQFLTNETDLAVAARITSSITELSGKSFALHDYDKLLSWWETNQVKYTNWPVEVFLLADLAFGAKLYEIAAKGFQEVLNIDPTADLSRAELIACHLELANTNAAKTLSVGFKHPDGRWAKWAEAKSELETGSRSNGTFMAAFVATNYTPFSKSPDPDYHVWRKLDAELWSRLTRRNSP